MVISRDFFTSLSLESEGTTLVSKVFRRKKRFICNGNEDLLLDWQPACLLKIYEEEVVYVDVAFLNNSSRAKVPLNELLVATF